MKKELDDAKASRGSIKNVKFIGELFNMKILSEAIMHSCIQRLLNNCDEESLECLCELLCFIGKELEVATAKRVMGSNFTSTDSFVKEGRTSSRVSITLKDIVDLRQKNWFPLVQASVTVPQRCRDRLSAECLRRRMEHPALPTHLSSWQTKSQIKGLSRRDRGQ